MSYQDDLDWLARNVHEWDDKYDFVSRWHNGVVVWAAHPNGAAMYHKSEWLARRSELQNKPGWKDAPEWALSVTQRRNGEWFWLGSTDQFKGPSASSGCVGEVLGDWHDTLELRPVSAGISGSEAAAGLKAFQINAAEAIDWSTAPEGATHHIGGDKLECPWHRVGGPLRYWNGKIWNKRSAFHTLDEAVAKGFAVVARPADLSSAAVIKRLDEATQNVLAAVPALMDEKYSFEPEFMPVSVSNGTVQLERPIAVAGTGNGSAAESAFLIGRVIDLLRTNVDHFSADELADLNELTGAELTKRDAAVCGGQKYLDAHWFERGELPPAGTKCEFCNSDDEWTDWHHCIFVGKDAHGAGVISIIGDDAGMLYRSGNPKDFRPIRTERDELVDVLSKAGIGSYALIAADAILAAGFKRGEA